MAFLFGRHKSRGVGELVKQAKDLVPKLDGPGQQRGEELAKLLTQMKLILQGTQETESSPEQVFQLISAMIQEDFLLILARSVRKLPFESRKDAQVIFSYVLRFKPPNHPANEPIALSYIVYDRPEVVIALCRGYDYRESAISCGTVLREALKHDPVAAIMLCDESGDGHGTNGPTPSLMKADINKPQNGDGVFWRFFDWIDKGSFEVSADAFTTFRELLTKHKTLVSQYLDVNFDLFFSKYHSTLIQSANYVTKRQSIKLLGDILLDRTNYQVMTSYVDRGEHLKMCMRLLRDERKMVQYEGFHVFKVFAANPHKSIAVQKIIWNNRERLLNFLPTFLQDRTDDEQFNDEKIYLIKQIQNMPPVDDGAPDQV
ncbi:MAG: hypothetical protein M1837_007162 [Sclerophora amabilis]|nr:MAG: hypothetical protein M1837_007162 [Sclerophora amabilis]